MPKKSRKPRDLVEPPVYTETAIGIPGLSESIHNPILVF